MKSQAQRGGKKKTAAVCRQHERESMRRRPDARWACSGMVYGLRSEQKRAKRGGSVSEFLSNLPKFPRGHPDSRYKKSWSY